MFIAVGAFLYGWGSCFHLTRKNKSMSQEQTNKMEIELYIISNTFGTNEVTTLVFENEQQGFWFATQLRDLNLTSGRNETEIHMCILDYFSETFHNQIVDDLKEIIQSLFNESKKIY